MTHSLSTHSLRLPSVPDAMGATADQAQQWQAAFGGRLRQLREEAGLSQMRLGELANLHPTYVSSVERGHRNVSLVNIHVIARALGVSPADLLST